TAAKSILVVPRTRRIQVRSPSLASSPGKARSPGGARLALRSPETSAKTASATTTTVAPSSVKKDLGCIGPWRIALRSSQEEDFYSNGVVIARSEATKQPPSNGAQPAGRLLRC